MMIITNQDSNINITTMAFYITNQEYNNQIEHDNAEQIHKYNSA